MMEGIMLTKDEILTFLRQHKVEIEDRFSVRRIGLFGSYQQDIAGKESDIDILVEMNEPTFDHYMDLKFYLEENLKRTVDLVLADTVKPRLKPIIAREVAYA
jgi:predicted nucleotidyltransferase